VILTFFSLLLQAFLFFYKLFFYKLFFYKLYCDLICNYYCNLIF
jgi:hypothetical protein